MCERARLWCATSPLRSCAILGAEIPGLIRPGEEANVNTAVSNRLALLRRVERRTLLLFREVRLGRGDDARADELREQMLDDHYVDRVISEKAAHLAGDLNSVIDGDVEVAHGETPFGLREGAIAYAKKWEAAGFFRAARVFFGLAQRIGAQ